MSEAAKKIIGFVCKEKDIDIAEKIPKIINDKYLMTPFISALNRHGDPSTEKRWLELIFSIIHSKEGRNQLDIYFNNNALLANCAAFGDLEKVKYLVERNADVNTNYGDPFKFACYNNHDKIMEYLVRHGADTRIYGYDHQLNNCKRKYKNVAIETNE